MSDDVTASHGPSPAADHVSLQPRPVARRIGYVIAATINGVIWYLVNVHPTWHAVPFLTADTRLVLPWFNLSWIATTAVNLVWVIWDPRWLLAAGNVVTTTLGLAALINLLRVFPFVLTPAWTTAVQILLVIAIIGTAIGLLVHVVKLAMIALGGSAMRGR